MHIAVITQPFPSHVSAFDALAAALGRRGHQVTLVSRLDAGRFPRTAMGFRPIGLASHPAGSLAPVLDRAARPGGPLGILRVVRDMADGTTLIGREGPAAIRALGADAILADQMEPAGGMVAEHLGLPFVSIAPALPINREPALPPPVLDWPYDPGAAGLRRNRGGAAVERVLMRGHARAIAETARHLGLPARDHAEDCLSPLAEIAQLVPGLDFPRTGSLSLHRVGPFRLPAGDEPPLDLPIRGGRPLVFISLGTLQGGRASLLARIARACRAAGAETVVAHCGRLTEAEAAALPADHVVDFAPQRALIARAALVVSHGGVNTVMDAMAAGVPLLVMPIAFDQPGMAARVRHAGAGLALRPRFVGEDRIRDAVARLIEEPTFRIRAAAIGREIAAAGGAERAADIAVTALTSGRPVLREVA